MATPRRDLQAEIRGYLGQQLAAGQAECSPEAIAAALKAPRSTVNYHLAQMVAEGRIQKRYGGPATRYALPAQAVAASWPAGLVSNGFQFSADRQSLIEKLTAPIGTRKPLAYRLGLALTDKWIAAGRPGL
ncbi:helix-turn-helix domain-containing protein [Ferribacterium limneticum]|uniref:helix-turn-helix domain-containing protein n=1 Tax=Ferribacterium limneticum TaxID=76259 RepID=UPI001CF86BE4|nr:helix-turn-helix domain-containing protein [Ferribacterium limneticum]UCV22317.1 helix-turn-helix transcriptional regulator [Ferribacterium limneticum]